MHARDKGGNWQSPSPLVYSVHFLDSLAPAHFIAQCRDMFLTAVVDELCPLGTCFWCRTNTTWGSKPTSNHVQIILQSKKSSFLCDLTFLVFQLSLSFNRDFLDKQGFIGQTESSWTNREFLDKQGALGKTGNS